MSSDGLSHDEVRIVLSVDLCFVHSLIHKQIKFDFIDKKQSFAILFDKAVKKLLSEF